MKEHDVDTVNLRLLEPMLHMVWEPEADDSMTAFNSYGILRDHIYHKLHKVCLEKVQKHNQYALKDYCYYELGTMFRKGKALKQPWHREEYASSLDKDTVVVSFEGSDDSEQIDYCGDFSQEMTNIMIVLDRFIDADGKISDKDFFADPEETIADVLEFWGCEKNEDFDEVANILSLIVGFELAFSKKSGPLTSEVYTFFSDLMDIFEGTISEYNLRQNFRPFFSLFYGNNDDLVVSVNVIGSQKIRVYKKYQDFIPDDEPLKEEIDRAISIFNIPINHEDVMTYHYDNDKMSSVVFVLVNDSYNDQCLSMDMLHPFYFDILTALHNDIDALFHKYHIER